jgi:hypothetical protein
MSSSSSRAYSKAAEAARDDEAPPEYTVAPVGDITVDPEEIEVVHDVPSIQQQQHEDPGDVPPPAYADVYGTLGFSQDGMNTTAQIQGLISTGPYSSPRKSLITLQMTGVSTSTSRKARGSPSFWVQHCNEPNLRRHKGLKPRSMSRSSQ